MSNLPDKAYWVACARFVGYGAKRLCTLMETFSSGREAFEAGVSAHEHAGIARDSAQEFHRVRHQIDPEREWERVMQCGLHVVVRTEDAFPPLLAQIPDAPAMLFMKGALPPADALWCALVGTRKMTAYGEAITRSLAQDLSAHGVVVVSGLALGVDGAAHDAVVRAGGVTVAVLGNGLDAVYPTSHTALAGRILDAGGALISEFPPGFAALKHHFPLRNRIIAGLSRCVIVTEAHEESGSLITARLGLEYNRDVAAVPGDVTRAGAAGPNQLIRMGATLVRSARDVLALYGVHEVVRGDGEIPVGATPEEQRVIDTLAHAPLHVDVLARALGASVAQLSPLLTMLEIQGKIEHIGGMQYAIVRT